MIDNGRAGDAVPILQKGLELNPGDNIVSIFPYLEMHLQISIRSDGDVCFDGSRSNFLGLYDFLFVLYVSYIISNMSVLLGLRTESNAGVHALEKIR